MPRTTGRGPDDPRKPAERGKSDTRNRAPNPKPKRDTKITAADARAAIKKLNAVVKTARRAENADRFLRVIYGGTNADGKKTKGRLNVLRKAFDYLAKATGRDHYEFTQAQGTAVINAVEIEMQKLRQVFEANAQPNR